MTVSNNKSNVLEVNDMNIAQRLRYLRNKRGYSAPFIADKLDCTRHTILNWERGHTKPDPTLITTLAKLYNTSSAFILGETNDESPNDNIENIQKILSNPDKRIMWGDKELSNEEIAKVNQVLQLFLDNQKSGGESDE
jgi:transcriptional regulator with XRE-family HTH domain